MNTVVTSLFSGAVVGLLVTVPVGPICMLCTQRTLCYGRRVGIASGCGSAAALALYGMLGAWGIGVVSTLPVAGQMALRLLGAGVLASIGWRIVRSVPQRAHDVSVCSLHPRRAFVSVFLLEIINPASIMIFVGLFLAQKTEQFVVWSLPWVGLGVFAASVLWWILLCSVLSIFRKYMTTNVLGILNKCAGLIIAGLALKMLIS